MDATNLSIVPYGREVIGKKGRTLLYKFYCICLTVGCGIL